MRGDFAIAAGIGTFGYEAELLPAHQTKGNRLFGLAIWEHYFLMKSQTVHGAAGKTAAVFRTEIYRVGGVSRSNQRQDHCATTQSGDLVKEKKCREIFIIG